MNIGIYSGSFDPIHTGHAVLANYIAGSGLVDEVWILVTPHNPIKSHEAVASDADRMAMARIVANRSEGVRASDFELRLPRPTYSYRTLRALAEAYPEHNFRIIVGADNYATFDRWRDADLIRREFGLIVYPRPGAEIDTGSLHPNVSYAADAPRVEISSTMVRALLAEGRNANFFVPCPVADYIRDRGLYAPGAASISSNTL